MNPNDTQVAGTHYRSSFQHWDLVVQLKLGYFEGQVTKYVTRHRSKNGRQDLDKATHFLMKLVSIVGASAWTADHKYPTEQLLAEYAEANRLLPQEVKVIRFVTGWVTLGHLKIAQHALQQLVQECYEPAPGLPWPKAVQDIVDGDAMRDPAVRAARARDDGGPGPEYVNQDR